MVGGRVRHNASGPPVPNFSSYDYDPNVGHTPPPDDTIIVDFDKLRTEISLAHQIAPLSNVSILETGTLPESILIEIRKFPQGLTTKEIGLRMHVKEASVSCGIVELCDARLVHDSGSRKLDETSFNKRIVWVSNIVGNRRTVRPFRENSW